MADRRLELALEKQRLQMQCQAQREVLAEKIAGVAPAIRLADGVRSGVDWLKQNPLVAFGGAVGLVVAKPRTVFRLAMRGFSIWRMVRAMRNRFGAF